MSKSIFGATIFLAGIIIYMGTFITMAISSGDGVDVRLQIYSLVWDYFPLHVVLSLIMLVGGLILLGYEVLQNKK